MSQFRALLLLVLALGGFAEDDSTKRPRYVTDEVGIIPYWIALEPLTITATEAKGAGLDRDYIGEGGAAPIAGEKVIYGDQEARWKLQAVEDGNAALDGEATDGARLYAVAYFVAYPVLEQDATLSVLWGCDDSGALFVNGKEVGRHVGGRGCAADSELADKIPFKRGVNTVMLKVLNESGGWAGCARLVDADHQPLAGVPLALAPVGKVASTGAAWTEVKTSAPPVKLPAPRASTPETKPTGWRNVRGNLGDSLWLMAAVPGKDELIAYFNQAGVWSSTDGGESWHKRGAGDDQQVVNLPHAILFDPQDAQRYWISGAYGDGIWGPGVFMTRDGGRSFARQGYAWHTAGIGVDFTDPQRKTLLVGAHEVTRRLYLSQDGGEKWFNIGKRLPADSGFCHSLIVLDARTFEVGCWSGWNPKLQNGIWRSEDAGATWSRIAEFGPSGNPLRLSDGSYLWPCGNFLIRSDDHGRTWTRLAGPAESSPVELPDGVIAAIGKNRIQISADGGRTWAPTCDPLPEKVTGIVYDAPRKTFFCWRSDAPFRWDGR